jgi:hypothetical protein
MVWIGSLVAAAAGAAVEAAVEAAVWPLAQGSSRAAKQVTVSFENIGSGHCIHSQRFSQGYFYGVVARESIGSKIRPFPRVAFLTFDYEGNPRQKDSDKPETKKIGVDLESTDARYRLSPPAPVPGLDPVQ